MNFSRLQALYLSRTWLTVLAGVAVLTFGGLAWAQMKPDTSSLKVEPLTIAATRLAGFERTDPSKKNFGKLTWRGGLVLTSKSANFGGWSGLALSRDSQSFVAVSDAGTWMEGHLDYDGDVLTGVSAARTGPLKARDGNTLSRRRDRDAEAVVLTGGSPGSGSLLIAFEQNDRIGRFTTSKQGIDAPSAYVDMPVEAKSMRMDGFEAVTVMQGGPSKGNMIAFTERARSGGDNALGWMWQNGTPKPLQLGGMAGFDVTDIASLPDGQMLVLERRFRWMEGVKMRVRRINAASIEAGASLDGEVLMTADLSQEIDNMEGLAVSQGPHGETVVTLISDDNFNKFLQRTLLLQFTLHE